MTSDEAYQAHKCQAMNALDRLWPVDTALPALTAPQWNAIYHVMVTFLNEQVSQGARVDYPVGDWAGHPQVTSAVEIG